MVGDLSQRPRVRSAPRASVLPLWTLSLFRTVDMHLLIVDDDASVRASLRDALATPLTRVSEAANAREALARLGTDPADVVLSDVRMPGMDGIELLRRLREAAPAAFVVLMTACGDAADLAEAAAGGARACLNKPLDLAELRALMDRLARERKQVPPQHGSPAQASESVP
jgi:DNA-binding NtrC family response regulator